MNARAWIAYTWLVIRPIQGWEDSMDMLLAAPTRSIAEDCADRINAFMESLRLRLARLPDPFEDGISDEEHSDRWDRRQRMITSARWPYGISLESDIGYSGPIAEVKALKFVERP